MELTEEQRRSLAIALVACLGEMRAVIMKDAGTRYSGASIDFAYEAAWQQLELVAPEEAKFQRQLDPSLIQRWLVA